nr:hypothetical protein [uncultured Psychroserpens sp.]
MKRLSIIIFCCIFISSCKESESTVLIKTKKLSYQENYVLESTKLLNQAFLPSIEPSENFIISKNTSKRQVYEVPKKLKLEDNPKYYTNISPHHEYTKDEVDSSNYYVIKNWKDLELDNIRIIDSTSIIKLRNVRDEYSSMQATAHGEKNKKVDSLFNIYKVSWETNIGDSYVYISSPIFNADFTTAYLISTYDDLGFCSFGRSFYEFTKQDGKWTLDENDYFK